VILRYYYKKSRLYASKRNLNNSITFDLKLQINETDILLAMLTLNKKEEYNKIPDYMYL